MSEKNHFQISVMENKPMNAWDIQVLIGGLKSKEAASGCAKFLAEYFENEFNAQMSRVN